MKLTSKTRGTLFLFLFLSLMAGTLAWEVVERVIAAAGSNLSLSVGPYGFDLGVFALWIRVNPGSIAGILTGYLLFRRV